MVKQTAIFIYRIGILPAINREGTLNTHNSLDESSENYAKKSELCEKSQSPKAKYCISPLYKHKHSQNDKVIEKENRFMSSRA